MSILLLINRKVSLRAPKIPYDTLNTHYCYVVWINLGLAPGADGQPVMSSSSCKPHRDGGGVESSREKKMWREKEIT